MKSTDNPDDPINPRYNRQVLLPFIGETGQRNLTNSRVLLIGCGALGGVMAEQLVRAGIGKLTLVDRDVVEWSNLQRQVLFEENDARDGVPKVFAAARRLSAINSTVQIDPHAIDLHAGNVESLAGVDLILDGTDNAETRYLLNDVAVKLNIPWIYGACVGTQGRMMTIQPGKTPCLQCVFPQSPDVGELQTCDTVGVLGPAIAVIAGHQSAAAIKLLSGHPDQVDPRLLTIDFWINRHHLVDVGSPHPTCRCCGKKQFVYLSQKEETASTALCGRNSVQVRPVAAGRLDLPSLATRLAAVGSVVSSPYLLRAKLHEPSDIVLSVFPDGRCIVQGTSDPVKARTLVSRFIGS